MLVNLRFSHLFLVGTLLGAAATLASVTGATARDNGGVQEFLHEQFGFGSPPAAREPAPSFDFGSGDRPLVVRPQRRHSESRPRVATVKGPTAPVTIFSDPTLRRGDAVMTATGIRIFRGGRSLPYSDADFVAVSDAGLSRNVEQQLVAINHLPKN